MLDVSCWRSFVILTLCSSNCCQAGQTIVHLDCSDNGIMFNCIYCFREWWGTGLHSRVCCYTVFV